MKKDVTLRIDAHLLRKAYEKVRRRALARLKEDRDLGWTPPGFRDELHER